MPRKSKISIKHPEWWKVDPETGKPIYLDLEEEDVRQVIEMFPYLNDQQIAKEFQVPRDTISNIRMNRTWKHIARK